DSSNEESRRNPAQPLVEAPFEILVSCVQSHVAKERQEEERGDRGSNEKRGDHPEECKVIEERFSGACEVREAGKKRRRNRDNDNDPVDVLIRQQITLQPFLLSREVDAHADQEQHVRNEDADINGGQPAHWHLGTPQFLSICRAFSRNFGRISRHGGRLRLESRPTNSRHSLSRCPSAPVNFSTSPAKS